MILQALNPKNPKTLNPRPLNLGHFQVGSYRYRSLLEGSIYPIEAL